MFAARVHFRPTANATPFREYRLFRNDPRIRFKGSMHETMLPDLEALQKTIGARIDDSPAEIIHFGYEAGSEWKHERNLPLLRAAISANPDRLYYWYHLAETLEALGQVDAALSVGAEGLVRARAAGPVSGGNAIAAMIAGTHAVLLHRKGLDALPTIEEGLAHYPRNPSLRMLQAKILIDLGRPEEVLSILEILVSTDSSTYQDVRLAHDRRIFDVHAPDLLGVALLRLGRRAEAAASFARAAAAAPEDPSYRVKAQALAQRQ
jgi:tetratricopeptide (TPR) repeat protein